MTVAANRTVLVDGAGADAEALRALLIREGWELREEPPVDVAYIDPWTPETSPLVATLRSSGAHVTCIADLVLSRATIPVVGVTGTAGKSTTSWILRTLLTRAGLEVHAATSPNGQLWPTCELLGAKRGVVLAELTSSHLCFMDRSPTVAVVTSFWPDHVELHGSLNAYRAAKERITRFQTADDVLVLPYDDDGTAWLRGLTEARIVWFAEEEPGPGDGVVTRADVLVARDAGREAELGDLSLRGAARRNALAAAAGALACGVTPELIAGGLDAIELPPHRGHEVGSVAGVPVIDDTLAATPAKTAAALRSVPDASVILVSGGRLTSEGGAVHAAAAEQRLLASACAEARRAARRVIVFGEAAERLEAELGPDATVERAGSFADALSRAFALASTEPDLSAVLVSPMFPLAQEERDLVASMTGRYAP